jgi:molybdopterin converting factor small subunit
MYINVTLYGDLKTHAPGDKNQFEMIIDPGATLEDIFKLFAIPEENCVSLINGRRVNKEVHFKEKDTLVLFPQICGG